MFVDDDVKKLAEKLFQGSKPNMGDALGIEFQHIGKNRVEATMPVNENTIQPFGLLHGGASVALGETLCSVGAWLNTDTKREMAVGMEINANHTRAVRSGTVTGMARPVHRGAKSQVWQYDIKTETGKLVCTGRCTLAIVPLK